MFLQNLFQAQLFEILLIAGSLIVALTIHEFGHALVASFLGDDTAKNEGRLTLNPLAHLDPWGLLFLVFAGFGWGRPVMYNPSNLRRKVDELLIALAGPAMNLLLALLLGLIYRIAAVQNPALLETGLFLAINSLISWNILLLAFNLIPIPPLDGSKIIEYFLSYDQRIYFEQIGVPILFLLLILQAAFGIPVFSRILDPLLQLFGFLTRSVPAGIG